MQNTHFTQVKLIFCFYGSNQILVELRSRGSLRPISKISLSEVLLPAPAAAYTAETKISNNLA